LSRARAAPIDVSTDGDGAAALYDLIFGDSALDARAAAYDRVRRMLKHNPHAVNGILDAVSDFLAAERGGDHDA